jgi:hypothetical protein
VELGAVVLVGPGCVTVGVEVLAVAGFVTVGVELAPAGEVAVGVWVGELGVGLLVDLPHDTNDVARNKEKRNIQGLVENWRIII